MSAKYDLIMHNEGQQDLREAGIVMDDYGFSIGWLAPNQETMHSRPSAPLGKSADVLWKRENSEIAYKQTISLKDNLPNLTHEEWYHIIFNVHDNNKVDLEILVCGHKNHPVLYECQ